MKAYVDRIEDNGTAVIRFVSGGRAEIPLPEIGVDVKEGSHLNIRIELDEESENNTAEEIEKLRKDLLSKDDSQN